MFVPVGVQKFDRTIYFLSFLYVFFLDSLFRTQELNI